MNRSGNININGDGNAVGNNNYILIDKRIFNTITHQPPPGQANGPGTENGSSRGINVAGLAVFVLIGVAIAAWKFAAYADEIYLAGILSSILVVGAQLLALGVGLWRSIPTFWLMDCVAGLFTASAITLAFYWSRQAFPAEISRRSKSVFRAFSKTKCNTFLL